MGVAVGARTETLLAVASNVAVLLDLDTGQVRSRQVDTCALFLLHTLVDLHSDHNGQFSKIHTRAAKRPADPDKHPEPADPSRPSG